MKTNCANRSGYTIIELIVAITIASAVITGVYYTWNTINRHIASRTKTGLLHEETIRLVRTISSDLRRSPMVLEWDITRISFINGQTGDTVIYSYNGSRILKNEMEFPLRVKDLAIQEFRIEQAADDIGSNSSRAHLQITIKATAEPNFEQTFTSDVSVVRPQTEPLLEF